MRRIFLYILALIAGFSSVRAQNEAIADTVSSPTEEIPPGIELLQDVKNFDGFLLDMRLMQTAAPPQLPRFTLQIPDASKDYSSLFRLNPDVSYSQGLSHIFSSPASSYYGLSPFGLMNPFGGGVDNLQMGTFRLKNGMRIHTYGQYNKDGWRVPNPSALPWEKNNFKGAFEMKSANGSFGLRIEVQHGRNAPF